MKKSVKFLTVCVSSIAFISCSNFALPKKVSVKTNAQYEATLGTASKDLKEFLGADAITEKIKSALPADASVSLYEVDQDDMEYVIRYPLMDVDLGDISSMTGGLDPSNILAGVDLSGFSFNQEINVPKIEKTATNSLTKSELETKIREMVGSGTVSNITGKKIAETGSATEITAAGEGLGSVTVDFNKCAAIQYGASDKIVIEFEKKDAVAYGPNYKLYVEAYIDAVDSGKYQMNRLSSGKVEVSAGNSVKLPLWDGVSGHALNPGFQIKFNVTTIGGTSGTEHTYDIKVTNNTQAQIIYEIAAGSTTELPISQEIEVPASQLSMLKEAVIGGTSHFSMQVPVPSSWSSMDPKPAFAVTEFSMTGIGLNVSNPLSDGTGTGYLLNKKQTLVGQTLDPSAGSKITITGKTSIDVSGCTIDMSKLPESLNTNVEFVVDEFSSMTVAVSSLTSGLSSSVSMPDTIKDLVKKISFGDAGKKHSTKDSVDTNCDGFGIKFKATNTFATGSDIPLKVSVGPFGFSETCSIESGKVAEEKALKDNFTYSFKSSDTEFSFSAEIGDASGNITLKDVVLGTDYKIGISDVELISDWDYVEIDKTKIAGFGGNMQGNMDLSEFNLKNIASGNAEMEALLEKVELKEAPVFFYASIPAGSSRLIDEFGASGFGGKVYVEKSDSTKEYLVGNDGSDGTISTVSVAWPADGTKINPNGEFYKNHLTLTDGALTGKYSFGKDLKDFIKGDYKALNYDIGVGTSRGSSDITIYSFDLSGEANSAKISMEVGIRLPLAFKITDDIEMEVPIPSDPENPDVLGRKDASSFDDYVQYANGIEYVALKYNLSNKVVPGFSGAINVKAFEGETYEINKSVVFEGGVHEFKFTGEDVKNIMTHYPFTPKVTVTVPDGDYALKKSGVNADDAISFRADIIVKMSGEPIAVWQSEGGAE